MLQYLSVIRYCNLELRSYALRVMQGCLRAICDCETIDLNKFIFNKTLLERRRWVRPTVTNGDGTGQRRREATQNKSGKEDQSLYSLRLKETVNLLKRIESTCGGCRPTWKCGMEIIDPDKMNTLTTGIINEIDKSGME